MNKFKYLIISLLVFPSIIYADCTNEEIKHFKEIEKNYKITYTLNKDTKDYTIKFYRTEPNMYDYLIDLDENIKCKEIDNENTECYNISPNTYNVEIVGQTDSCQDTFKSLTLKLPKYNSYADDPLCEGIEEFVLCQETYDKDIDYDTFVSRVNTYKKTKTAENENNTEENQNNSNKVLEYIQNNLFTIIVVIVFVILVIITTILTAKSIKKSRRLE